MGPATAKTRTITIVGPTAVGKTEVTLSLAIRLGAEVISADAMQVYRGMDIGTAKPSREERAVVPHHLIDLVEPDRPFSVAEWVALARRVIASVRERGRVPLVSGGTPLYVEALFGRFSLAGGTGPDPALRARLRRQAETHGPSYLHRKLQAVDPIAAERVHPSDLKRTIRALEVYLTRGKPLSQLQRGRPDGELPGNGVVFAGLRRPREELLARIEERVETMLGQGLIEEVRALVRAGYDPALPSMQAVGYKELAGYLTGRVTFEEAKQLMLRNTRRLAKRQMTWFRSDPRIQWFIPGTNRGLWKILLPWREEKDDRRTNASPHARPGKPEERAEDNDKKPDESSRRGS